MRHPHPKVAPYRPPYRPRPNTKSLRVLAPGWQPFPPSPPPPTGVLVESVTLYNEEYLLWTFSANLTAVADAPPQLEASPDGVTFDSAQGWEHFAANELLLWYKNIALGPGATYRVLTAPTGLTFASGATLTLPESGTVTVA